MLATCLHGMQGTPYIYQGEELGMTNVQFDIQEYRDIELLNMYKERIEQGYKEEDVMRSVYVKGRDNARTPMQWNEGPNAGFTEGTPWIRCNPNYTMINAEEALIDQDSIFYYYQKLIRLRKTEPILTEGKFQLLLKDDPCIFAYTRTTEREQLLVLCNFKGQEVSYELPDTWNGQEVLISNYAEEGSFGTLRPFEAKMIIIRKGE